MLQAEADGRERLGSKNGACACKRRRHGFAQTLQPFVLKSEVFKLLLLAHLFPLPPSPQGPLAGPLEQSRTIDYSENSMFSPLFTAWCQNQVSALTRNLPKSFAAPVMCWEARRRPKKIFALRDIVRSCLRSITKSVTATYRYRM